MIWCARSDSNGHAGWRRGLSSLRLPIPPLAHKTWCADRGSNPDAFARRPQRRLYTCSSIGTNLVRAEGFEPPRSYPLRSERRVSTRSTTRGNLGGRPQSRTACQPLCRRRGRRFPAVLMSGGLSRIRTCKLARSSRVTAGSCHPSRLQPKTWWAEGDSNSHAEAALFGSAVYSHSTIGPIKKPPDYSETDGKNLSSCLPPSPHLHKGTAIDRRPRKLSWIAVSSFL